MLEEVGRSAVEECSSLQADPVEQSPQKLLLAPLLEQFDRNARSQSTPETLLPRISTQIDRVTGWGIDSPSRKLPTKVQDKSSAVVAKPEAERQGEGGGTLPSKSVATAASTWLRSWWQLSQAEDEDLGSECNDVREHAQPVSALRPGIEQMRSQLLKCVRLLKELQAENASLCHELEKSRYRAAAAGSEVEALRKENALLRTKLEEANVADSRRTSSFTIDSGKGELYQMQVALVAIVEDLEARLAERDAALEKSESRLVKTQAQLHELATTPGACIGVADVSVEANKAYPGEDGYTMSIVAATVPELCWNSVDAREEDEMNDAQGEGKCIGKGLSNADVEIVASAAVSAEPGEIGPVGTVPRNAKVGRGMLPLDSPAAKRSVAKSKEIAKPTLQ